MQMLKRMLPVMLAFTILFTGCSSPEEKAIETVITDELNLLKNLDADTVEKYSSCQQLFSDSREDFTLSPEVEDVFSLFFKDFDYKIMEIQADKKTHTANATVRLTTIDARSVASDFARAYLKSEIMAAARKEDTSSIASLENRYLLLHDLLKSNKYEKVETTCTMYLTMDEKENWSIQKDASLENNLVGNLISYLADPDILNPEETLTTYLDTIKSMSEEEMCNYFKMQNVLNTEDTQKNELASALASQLHKHFDYSIKETDDDGYQASVTTEITTFDSTSIMENYESQFDEYLSTADAVIDGSEGRQNKSHELLLSCIQENTASSTSSVVIHMINDGVSWKMEMDTALEESLFGSLSSASVSEQPESGEESGSEESSDDGEEEELQE